MHYFPVFLEFFVTINIDLIRIEKLIEFKNTRR